MPSEDIMPHPALRQDAARRPRWKPMPQPRALERAYYATLLAVVNRTFAALRKKLAPHLPADAAKRQDAEGDEEAPDNGALVTFTIEEVEVEFVRAFPTASVRAAAERTAREVDTAHLKAMRRQFSETLGINILQEAPRLRPTVEEFTKRNVALIKSIPQEAIEGLRKALVEKGLEKGIRPEALAKTLQERYGIAQRRAQLIATDQVGKMMANLTEERHRELGVTSYRWRTVRDNRVRRIHVKREGVVFRYDDPPHDGPGDGHPGFAVRCRCWSEPILDEPLPVEEALEVERKTVDPAPAEAKPATQAPRERIAVAAKRAEKVAAQQVKQAATPAAKKPATRSPAVPDPVAVARALVKPRAASPSPLKAQVKPPAKVKVPATVAPAREASPSQAVQPVPVDRSKGWKPTRVYLVPIEELADVPALAWNGRDKSIRKAYEAGRWEDLPPVMVITENKATGARELDDGNHRLAVARELGAKFVAVRFGDREAAGLRARPPNPGLPWFVRENPERFGYRIPAASGKQASRPTTVFPAPPAKKKPTASRKAPATKTPTKTVTTKSTPAKALPAKRNNPPPAAAMSLPLGPVRGVDAEAVMQVFPEVNVVGDILRVDEFSHPTVRSEVADLANLPPDLLRLLPKVANDIHIAPAPVTELGRSGSTAKMKNVRPRGFEEGSTMDQAAGLFVSEFKEVLVSARFNTVHTSIVLHEIGHAFDGSHFKKRTSTTAEFESAWDAFRAGPYSESRNPYYNQQYPAGPGETFAESFAVYFRFGASEATRRFGPEVVKVLESKYGPAVFKPRGNQ